MRASVASSICFGLIAFSGCTRPGEPLKRQGDEIVAAGQLFHTGTPVVLWLDPKGYDAYSGHQHFNPAMTMPSGPASPGDPHRYGTRRKLSGDLQARVDEQGWTLANLRQTVDQFVIHFDVCGTSRQCFKILHDVRGLSVPFMLDIDGTIYQTLDLKERAWHAGTANDHSVGVEIAQIGAYRDMQTLEKWYALDDSGWPYLTLPDYLSPTCVRTPDFVGRPARKEVITGTINDSPLMQYDFTKEQYDALIKLTATLARVFPNLKLDAPREPDGTVRPNALSESELAAYQGLLGHYHVTTGKTDPGPAFDWERVLRGARREAHRLF